MTTSFPAGTALRAGIALPPGTAPPVLQLDRVSRHFGGLKAVDGVTLDVRPGARHALIGPNGAGKTTLFNVISGETAATTGTIRFLGADVTAQPSHVRAARGIARTFQIIRLFPSLTVRENVLMACQALDPLKYSMLRLLSSCRTLTSRADELLVEFGLSELQHESARHLSYGDQRKVEVALSMAGRPRLLLLDEPMAGLSGGERDAMQHLLAHLDPAMAVLLIEHDMDVAFGFADTVTVLNHGTVLAHGSTAEVSADERVQRSYLGVS
jgi:branched-chain amino acid transport system ATP-binding protein